MQIHHKEQLLRAADADKKAEGAARIIKLNSPLKPDLNKLFSYLEKVNENAWFTNFGELHDAFSNRLKAYFGIDNLLLINNGTTALQIASKALKCKNTVTTPYSFLATSSALHWQGVDLEYADICKASFNLDPLQVAALLKTSPLIDSVVSTHVYGNPCDIPYMQEVANEFGVNVIYDAAQCFGVKHQDKSIIAHGDASIMSFHATKVFHSVEGGAIWFNDPETFETASKMINFGLHNGDIATAGINGKLNEYQAAVGLTLLDGIDKVIQHRIHLYQRYFQNLHASVVVQRWNPNSSKNGGYFPIVLSDPEQCSRLQRHLLEKGIETRQYFIQPLHQHYGSSTNRCSSADSLIPRVLTMPLHAHMDIADVDWVCENVLGFLSVQ